MKIVHISDWHGKTIQLPKADLYVCTGDMFPNFQLVTFRTRKQYGERLVKWDPNGPSVDPSLPKFTKPDGDVVDVEIIREREERLQALWIKDVLGSYRKCFASPDAPVVCVRGNHDFIPLSEAFGGDVWEVDDDPSRTIDIGGLKFGGCRGVNTINGMWNDETPQAEFYTRVDQISNDIDVLLSHAPPYGILDFEGEYWGSQALARHINQRFYVDNRKLLKLHCFGHVHAQHGVTVVSDMTFSNASTGFNIIEV